MKQAIMSISTCIVLAAAFVIPRLAFAQTVKEAFLDTNKVYTIFDNRGGIGNPLLDAGLVWPWPRPDGWFEPNTISYISRMGLLIGGEVINVHGDTIRIIDDGFPPGWGDYEPGAFNPWGWLPLSGYDNPSDSSVAISDDSSTWYPSSQAWPGKHGNGILSADLETFWVMNDSSNAEFDYYPIMSDSSFRGLGIEVSCRGYQWDTPPFEDFIIFTYDIKNVSDNVLDKLVVGFFADPAIGGPNDFADDIVGYIPDEDLVLCWDADGIGDGGRTGMLGFVTLESPDNVGLTSVVSASFTSDILPKNDSLMWNFLTPDSTHPSQPAYPVVIFGSGYFSLRIGETKTYSIACIPGAAGPDNVQESRNAYATVTSLRNPDMPEVSTGFSLYANYPNPFNPTTTISYALPVRGKVKLAIYNLLGQQIRTLVNAEQPAGVHQVQWDGRNDAGKQVSSGIYFYQLKAGNSFLETKKMVLLR